MINKIQINISMVAGSCTRCEEATKKTVYVRGHFRVTDGKKVYVRGHYRKR